jgi:hypothetical protein
MTFEPNTKKLIISKFYLLFKKSEECIKFVFDKFELILIQCSICQKQILKARLPQYREKLKRRFTILKTKIITLVKYYCLSKRIYNIELLGEPKYLNDIVESSNRLDKLMEILVKIS